MGATETRVKRFDTAPPFQATLRDGNGNPADLTGATALILIRNTKTRRTKVVGTATILSQITQRGKILYNWAVTDLDTAGAFQLEMEITFADGTRATFPSQGYHNLIVLPDVVPPRVPGFEIPLLVRDAVDAFDVVGGGYVISIFSADQVSANDMMIP